MTRGKTDSDDRAEATSGELLGRMVAGIRDLAWKGLLSEQDAIRFTDRVREIAAANRHL